MSFKENLTSYCKIEKVEPIREDIAQHYENMPPIWEQREYVTQHDGIPDVPIIISLFVSFTEATSEQELKEAIAEFTGDLELGFIVFDGDEAGDLDSESAGLESIEDPPEEVEEGIMIGFMVDPLREGTLPPSYELTYHYKNTISAPGGMEAEMISIGPEQCFERGGDVREKVKVECEDGHIMTTMVAGHHSSLRTVPEAQLNWQKLETFEDRNGNTVHVSVNLTNNKPKATVIVKAIEDRSKFSIYGRGRRIT